METGNGWMWSPLIFVVQLAKHAGFSIIGFLGGRTAATREQEDICWVFGFVRKHSSHVHILFHKSFNLTSENDNRKNRVFVFFPIFCIFQTVT